MVGPVGYTLIFYKVLCFTRVFPILLKVLEVAVVAGAAATVGTTMILDHITEMAIVTDMVPRTTIIAAPRWRRGAGRVAADAGATRATTAGGMVATATWVHPHPSSSILAGRNPLRAETIDGTGLREVSLTSSEF